MHHSIVITGVQYLIPKCTTCCTLYHCPLCPSLKPMSQKKVQFHWEVHLKNAINFQDKKICKCHLHCRSDSHFHCPCCSKTVLRRHAMQTHLQLCLTAQNRPPRLSNPVLAKPSNTPAPQSSPSTTALAPCTSTPEISAGSAPCIFIASVSAPCTSTSETASVSSPCISIASVSSLCTSAPEISSVSTPCTSTPELCDSTPSQFPLDSVVDRKRTTCPHCSAVMLKKNLNIHIQRKHSDYNQDVSMQSNLYGVCIDMFNGVYAVQKSGNGFSVPVHVQRKTWGKEYQLKCDLQECWENQQLASSSEQHTFSLCEHLSSLDYCCETVFEELLDPSVLDEMVRLKLFGETKKAVCLRRQKVAQTAHVPFSVLVTFGDSQKRFTLSIYEPVVNQFSRLGRVMVTYNSTTGTWNCPCAKPRMSCPHKNIAKWHLFQTNIELFTSQIPSDEALVKQIPEDLNCAIQFDLHRTVEYVYSMKKIPLALQDGAHPKSASDFPSSLCPVESCCLMCDDNATLELPMLTTRNAQIVTMAGVINDVSTYTRRCPGCQMIYRYQEWCDGLHNFNNNIILSLELCLFLRHSLQSHVGLSRVIDTLESLRGETYPDRDIVLQAYCHFEALAEIDYTYSCVNCGDHPPVVIMDLLKNGVFSTAASDLKEPPSEFKGEVNIEDFWQSVDQEMIACGFVSSRAQNPFVVEPSYENWAPWIGEKTRKGSTVLNTEYEKVTSPENQAFSVSEDRLVEELMKQEVDDVRKLCKDCNVDSNGSAFDMILRLRAEMQNKQAYKKIYQKICGSSGGCSVVMCPHGVVYSLKFNLKLESPRDFVDLLLSWQHLPNVTICDSPGDLATHANTRTPTFHPHEGRLADATLENISKANQETLRVSLPWLLEKTDNLTSNAHPVTGSSEHFVLSDKLDETDVKDPKDVLRNVRLVPELQDWLNRQAAEQFVADLRENDYFTNHMTPSIHMFMMRNIIHYRNVATNQLLLRGPL